MAAAASVRTARASSSSKSSDGWLLPSSRRQRGYEIRASVQLVMTSVPRIKQSVQSLRRRVGAW
jgi:hypothetical protein